MHFKYKHKQTNKRIGSPIFLNIYIVDASYPMKIFGGGFNNCISCLHFFKFLSKVTSCSLYYVSFKRREEEME